ncbi:putative -like protein, partial [Trichinella papuae]
LIMSVRKQQRNHENACDIGLKFCRSFRRFRFNLMKIQEKCERISQTYSHKMDVIKINNLEKLTEEKLPIDVEVSSVFTEEDFFCDFQRMPTLTRNSHKSCFTCSNDATYCLRSTFSSFLENEVHCGARKGKSKGFHNFLRGNIVDIPRWPHSQRMVDNVYIPKATYSIITVLDGAHPFDNGNGFQKIPLNEAYMKNKLFLNRMHFYQLWEFESENSEMAGFYPEAGNQQAVENEKSLQLELQKRRLRLVKYTSKSLLFGRKAFLLIIVHSLLKMLLNTLIDESLNMDYALDKVEDNVAELNLNSNDSNECLDLKLNNEEKDEDEEQHESTGRLICNIDSLLGKESNSKTGDSEFDEFIISDDGISYSADSSKMQSLFNKRTEELEKLERHYAESQALLSRSKHECNELRILFEQTKQEQTGKISLLENELKEKEKQIRLMKDNLSSLEAHCRKTVSDCEANFLLQKEQLLRSSEIAEREKNNAVVKYAQREKEILVLESSNQKLQQQIRQLISDRDALGSQLRAGKNVRDGLVTACEKKDLEISNLRKEADRLKFQIQEGDVRLKIAYKKNDELVEALRVSNSELDRLKSELSNFSGKLIDQMNIDDKTNNAATGVENACRNANDLPKRSAYSSLPDESLHLQERLRELEECNLSKENCIDELRSKLSEHESTLEEQKRQIDQLSDELEQLNLVESKWQACQRDLAKLESDCQQAELEANECRQETERLLQLVETLTNSNTLLKTENLTLTSKVQSLENADSSNSEIVERLNQRLTNLEEEYLEHQRNARTEVESLEALLSEKAQLGKIQNPSLHLPAIFESHSLITAPLAEQEEAALRDRRPAQGFDPPPLVSLCCCCCCLINSNDSTVHSQWTISVDSLLSNNSINGAERELTTSLLDEQNTIKVLKRKHQAYAKELKAEICILKRRLDNYESSAASQCSGSSVADEHSRAPSPSSWSCNNNNNNNSNNNNNALPNGDVQAEYQPATFNHVQTTVCEHNQLMIEKIVKLQRALARRNEKIEFLEEHMKSLFHEIRKKTKIIQSYVIREEAGMLTSATFDLKKLQALLDQAEIAKRGHTLMSNLFSTGMSNKEINLELAVEMLRKLQAVLEDTLLKNITFKESVDTLGEEIARLSRENRDLKLKVVALETGNLLTGPP